MSVVVLSEAQSPLQPFHFAAQVRVIDRRRLFVGMFAEFCKTVQPRWSVIRISRSAQVVLDLLIDALFTSLL
jgi:hypothetical protein